MTPTAWYDPSNGVVSTDRDCPLFTPLGQVWPLYLERTEQEPVCPECKAVVLYECVACSSNNYPPQRTWVALTDEEISEITSKVIGFNSCVGWEEDYARAIEQALKEKNTCQDQNQK